MMYMYLPCCKMFFQFLLYFIYQSSLLSFILFAESQWLELASFLGVINSDFLLIHCVPSAHTLETHVIACKSR